MVIMSKSITLHIFLLFAAIQLNAEIVEKSKKTGLISFYLKYNGFGPGSYSFGYEIRDNATGNVQFRDERRYMNASMEGSFGYVQPDGRVTLTTFVAGNKTGYLSSTETFYAKNNSNWMQFNRTSLSNLTYDHFRHLNISQYEQPVQLTDRIMPEEDINLKRVDLQKDILDPIEHNILNAEIPAVRHKNGTLSFQNVTHFIPGRVPIVPFQLPTKIHDRKEIETDFDAPEHNDLLPPKPLVPLSGKSPQRSRQ